MELNKKAAYLQGLVDGLGIDDTTKEGKIIKAMSALLGEMAEVIESVDEDLSRAYDQINDLSDELEDLEADLYEEEDEDGESEDAEDEDSDGDDDDDSAFQVKLQKCCLLFFSCNASSLFAFKCRLALLWNLFAKQLHLRRARVYVDN